MSRRLLALLMALALVAGALGCGSDSDGSASPQTFGQISELDDPAQQAAEETAERAEDEAGRLAGIPADQREAIATVLRAIASGEQLPYSQDGSTFQNREGLLPDEPIGYYREYTVDTPGLSHRGARRLVIGEGGEVYYTDDHYASFTRIDSGGGP